VTREQLVSLGIGALSIVVGIPLASRRVPPNRWYGLRIPATLADEHVWYEANAVTGRDLIVVGIVLLLVAFILPRLGLASSPGYAALCVGVLALGSSIATVRGWRMATRLLQERRSVRPTPPPSTTGGDR
jgi:uncharacterized membrane protein